MKQLTCEMCGSTDLMKQDGVFVCQTCGCKYSVEEARKMMVEGTVEVQGTVKVDNSALVEKYLANARRAKQKEDWEETEKYYNMVEQNNPDNIEAIFYSAYGKAMATLSNSDINKRKAAFNVFTNCISMIDDHYSVERAEEYKGSIQNMVVDLGKMISSEFVYEDSKLATFNLFFDVIRDFRESIKNIQQVDDQPYLHEELITFFTTASNVHWTGLHRLGNKLYKDWSDEEKKELETLRTNIRINRHNAYWSDHKEEKEALEAEKTTLNEQIKSIKNQMGSIPEIAEIASVEGKLADLMKQKDSLGMFKGKEKKALQEQINYLEKELIGVKNRKAEAEKPYIEQIHPLVTRIEEIDREFLKDR